MKRIYYLQEYLVEIGDIVDYKGLRTLVTESLIKLNPELFVVKDSIQELMDKAIKDYPIGTVFNNGSGIQRVTDNNYQCMPLFKNIVVSTDIFAKGGTIYHPIDGWAPILPYLFTSEDGVKIYRSMKTYAVKEDDQSLGMAGYFLGNNPDYTYFYHKENALAYIEKHKEKTLRDYEEMLFERDNSMITSSGIIYFSVYRWLKDNEPKLYYTKILQLIADDLNDGWVADFTNHNEKKWFITKETVDFCYHIKIQSVVYFKLRNSAQKARDILGDKINHLFNN